MKYKLIKNYLGCDYQLNTIINSNFVWVNGKKVELRDFPEHWELVVEKEFEILTIKSPYGPSLLNPYGPSLLKGECVDNYIEVTGYEINSVKRLSDGEVFTVGDKVNNTYFSTKILSFSIIIDKLKILTLSGTTVLNNIKHIKKPLFTTTDGVEIFEGYEISHWVKGDVVIPDYVYRFVCVGYTPESNEQWIVTDKGATRLDGKYKDETLTGVYHKICHSLC